MQKLEQQIVSAPLSFFLPQESVDALQFFAPLIDVPQKLAGIREIVQICGSNMRKSLARDEHKIIFWGCVIKKVAPFKLEVSLFRFG